MKVSVKSPRTIEQRVSYVRDKIRKGKVDPEIIGRTRQILSRKCGTEWCVPEKNWGAEVNAIFRWVRDNVRYIHDPHGVDTFGRPGLTIKWGGGDCLPEDTLLVRRSGDVVRIADTEIGDEIMDGSGGWSRVEQKWDKGVLPILQFGLNNGSVLSCTADHVVLGFGAERLWNVGLKICLSGMSFCNLVIYSLLAHEGYDQKRLLL